MANSAAQDVLELPSTSKPPTKVSFVSLGCPKNLVDTEVMMGMLAEAGAKLVKQPQDADVIVVNTCSFIANAQQESVDTILEMSRLKGSGGAQRLVVAGCLVERFRDQIRRDIPEVDAVVGTGELGKILLGSRNGFRTGAARTFSDFGHATRSGSAGGARTLFARKLGRRGWRSSELSLRRGHTANSSNAVPYGVYQDRGRV